jgi:hypothetical protein
MWRDVAPGWRAREVGPGVIPAYRFFGHIIRLAIAAPDPPRTYLGSAPNCPVCFQTRNVRIPMKRQGVEGEFDFFVCPSCNAAMRDRRKTRRKPRK